MTMSIASMPWPTWHGLHSCILAIVRHAANHESICNRFLHKAWVLAIKRAILAMVATLKASPLILDNAKFQSDEIFSASIAI